MNILVKKRRLFLPLLLSISSCIPINRMIDLPSTSPIPSINPSPIISSYPTPNVITPSDNIKGNFIIYSSPESNLNKFANIALKVDENGNGYFIHQDGFIQKIESYKFTDIKLKISEKPLESFPLVKINKDGKGIIIQTSAYQPQGNGSVLRIRDYQFYYILDNFKIIKKIEKAPIFDNFLIDEKGDGIAYRFEREETIGTLYNPPKNIYYTYSRKINNYELSEIETKEVSKSESTIFQYEVLYNNEKSLELVQGQRNFTKLLEISNLNPDLIEITNLLTSNETSIQRNGNNGQIDSNGNGVLIINKTDLIPIQNYQLKNTVLKIQEFKDVLLASTEASINLAQVDKNGNGLILITENKYSKNSFVSENIISTQIYSRKIINYKLDSEKNILNTSDFPNSILYNSKISDLSENGDGIIIFPDNKNCYARYIKNYELQ